MSLWNGNRAALSLTFDDGLACQLEHAVPVMTKRRVPGTFFLIEKSEAAGYGPLNVPAWKQAVADGHEIGSHSTSHKKAGSLSVEQCAFEAIHSKQFLEKTFDVPVTSYCYPYTDAPGVLQSAVRQAGYTQARGGRVARLDKFITGDSGINIFNTPCYHVNEAVVSEVSMMLSAALWRQAWVILMLHGVGPDYTQWDNVGTKAFDELLDIVCRARQEGLWVATFKDVAQNYQQFGSRT